MNVGIKAPCKDCFKREPSCHAQCDEYIVWKQEIQERRNLINSKKGLEHAFDDRRKEAIKKFKRTKNNV